MNVVDYGIVEAARNLMTERYVEGRHQVGAALRTKSGNLFVGVHVEATCGRITLCGRGGCRRCGGDGPYSVPISSLLPQKFDGSRYPNRRKNEAAQ